VHPTPPCIVDTARWRPSSTPPPAPRLQPTSGARVAASTTSTQRGRATATIEGERYACGRAQELTASRARLDEDETMENEPRVDTPRVLRLESELHFRAPPERLFRALTDPDEIVRWFPTTHGRDRVKRLVFEQRVGGVQYEDWGDGRGHLYGQVTEWDPPWRYAVRSRLHPGTVMDTLATIASTSDGATLHASRVIVGPISLEQEAAIRRHGDFARFHDAIRSVVEEA